MGLALQQDLLPEEQKVKWSMHFGSPEEELLTQQIIFNSPDSIQLSEQLEQLELL